jgi:serine phosphatase RsbU (regulator of sigma subunit)
MFHRFLLVFFALSIGSPLYSITGKSAADSLLRELKKDIPDTTRVNILIDLCNEYAASDTAIALGYGRQALETALESGSAKWVGTAYFNIGAVYYDQSDYYAATLYFTESLNAYKEAGSKKGMANACGRLGNIHLFQGNYSKSLDFFLTSLKTYEEVNEKSRISATYNNIGIIYYNQGNLDKALENYLKALKIDEELGDQQYIALSVNSVAGVYLAKKDYDQALSHYMRSLEMLKEVDDQENVAAVLSNIGEIYSYKEELKRSLEYHFKALSINTELGNKMREAMSLTSIALVYVKLGEYDKALSHFNKSVAISKEIGSKEDLKINYEGLADLYAKSGQFDKAYQYYQLYTAVKDSILNDESIRQMAEIQTRYESEKKEKEIQILTKDKEHDKAVKNFLGAGALLVLLLAGVIYNRYRLKNRANRELSLAYEVIGEKNKIVEEKNKIVEEKNKNITDSIKYAKRLQQAILPASSFAEEFGDNGFILYKPKDIVSGDFYWLDKQGGKVLVAAVDCTGHGVPGAFMSIIGYNLLNQIVHDDGITVPSDILFELNKGVSATLSQKVEDGHVRDGMDLALCSIDQDSMVLEYAGAYNPVWLLREGHIIEVKADKYPIGAFLEEQIRTFTNHRLDLQKGDIIYMFSDGYADQFGGPVGKKFKYKKLKELLITIHKNSMRDQRQILDHTIEAWRGDLEQVDDIMVIGIKI